MNFGYIQNSYKWKGEHGLIYAAYTQYHLHTCCTSSQKLNKFPPQTYKLIILGTLLLSQN